jgi:hypothetical protein
MRGRRVIVPGWQNRFVARIPRFLPRGLLLDLVARSQAHRHRTRVPIPKFAKPRGDL